MKHKTNMKNFNPNRFVCIGYLRGVILNKNNMIQLIPLNILTYLKKRLKGNPTYEEFIREQSLNVFRPNNIKQKWDSYSKITNIFVELNEKTNLETIKKLHDYLYCELIIFNVKHEINIDFLDFFSEYIKINFSVNIFIIDSEDHLSEKTIKKLLDISVISKIYKNESYKKIKSEKLYFKRKVAISKLIDFTPNSQLILESYSKHTYFNKKIYIGKNGEIKNSFEDKKIFGYSSNDLSIKEIRTIIKSKEFRKYWNVHKEICDICKDCELRHVCVDNRLPYKRKKNEWYHKIECNYNPYIAKWKDEEGYKTLAECGVTSNEHEFSIDHKKIALINKELWED